MRCVRQGAPFLLVVIIRSVEPEDVLAYLAHDAHRLTRTGRLVEFNTRSAFWAYGHFTHSGSVLYQPYQMWRMTLPTAAADSINFCVKWRGCSRSGPRFT